ncbi:hypothetical protein PLESTF_000517300 [Pleodorina starrii]|nr:hypothetical protein PLESTF_000517300 [Pleodorina starrii]
MSCPGSLARSATTCIRLTNQTACNANADCSWNPSEVTKMATEFVAWIVSWVGGDSGPSSLCSPKWVNNATVVNDVVAKMGAATSDDGASASNVTRVLLNDIVGNCTGVSGFHKLMATCTSSATSTNRTTCEGTPGCAWTWLDSSMAAGGACDVASNFPMDLLVNQSDTWVSAVYTARRTCLPLNSTNCNSSAIIVANTSRYADFAAQQPQFETTAGGTSRTGAAGLATPAASMVLSSVVLSLVMGLFAKMSI